MPGNNDVPDFLAMLDDITTADIEEFFGALGKGATCPVCGDSLVAFTDMDQRPDGYIRTRPAKPAILMRPVHTPPPHTPTLRLPAITACCDTCGFMADFSVAPLLEWKSLRHGR